MVAISLLAVDKNRPVPPHGNTSFVQVATLRLAVVLEIVLALRNPDLQMIAIDTIVPLYPLNTSEVLWSLSQTEIPPPLMLPPTLLNTEIVTVP